MYCEVLLDLTQTFAIFAQEMSVTFNVQWLGVSFGKLLVGSGSVFYIFSLTGEGRPQSKLLLIAMFSLFQHIE